MESRRGFFVAQLILRSVRLESLVVFRAFAGTTYLGGWGNLHGGYPCLGRDQLPRWAPLAAGCFNGLMTCTTPIAMAVKNISMGFNWGEISPPKMELFHPTYTYES